MELIDDEIWCDVHGCIHEATTDPYEYGYEALGEEPECGPEYWRKLWAGAQYEAPKEKAA